MQYCPPREGHTDNQLFQYNPTSEGNTQNDHKVTFRKDIMSVLGLDSGYTAKCGHILPYIPPLLLIRIQHVTQSVPEDMANMETGSYGRSTM